MRWLRGSAVLLALALGCARAPRPSYGFDPAIAGWELVDHVQARGARMDRYGHAVHTERLEVWEVAAAAPAAHAAEFAALAPAARVLPPLGTPTATARSLGDEELAGTQGFWVEQRGRVGDDQLQAAAFVVPGGRRHFVVRMSSLEDDVEQLRGWVRDLVLRSFRFPAPQR